MTLIHGPSAWVMIVTTLEETLNDMKVGLLACKFSFKIANKMSRDLCLKYKSLREATSFAATFPSTNAKRTVMSFKYKHKFANGSEKSC